MEKGRKDSQKFRLSLRPFLLHLDSVVHSNNDVSEPSSLMDLKLSFNFLFSILFGAVQHILNSPIRD